MTCPLKATVNALAPKWNAAIFDIMNCHCLLHLFTPLKQIFPTTVLTYFSCYEQQLCLHCCSTVKNYSLKIIVDLSNLWAQWAICSLLFTVHSGSCITRGSRIPTHPQRKSIRAVIYRRTAVLQRAINTLEENTVHHLTLRTTFISVLVAAGGLQ